jgi:hypothetical protein
MDVFAQIAEKIIESQEAIIGPVAVEQAQQVPHLHLDWSNHTVSIDGDESQVIDNLIAVYKELFGQISVEVSKEAAGKLLNQLTSSDLPEALR